MAHEFTVSGAYAASFGGFVVQGNVGQIHVFLADGRKHSTDWWVGRFREMARQAAPGAQTVVVPVTGSGGGNAQPIDELVTDVAGGDPTSAALRVLDILRGTPGAAERVPRSRRFGRVTSSRSRPARSIGTAPRRLLQ